MVQTGLILLFILLTAFAGAAGLVHVGVGGRSAFASTGAQGLMILAMAGMLTPGSSLLPASRWSMVFAALSLWYLAGLALEAHRHGLRRLLTSHRLTHAIHCAAGLYMFVAVAPTMAAPIMGLGRVRFCGAGIWLQPGSAVIVIAALLLSCVQDLLRIPLGTDAAESRGRVLGLTGRAAMGASMAAMLVAMV
jgi:hypothetical protein